MSGTVAGALSRSYAVGGESVTFACDDPELAGKAAALVAGWHFSALPESLPSSFRITLSCEAPPPVPHADAAFPVHHGECFIAGEFWYLTSADSRVRVHPLSGRRIDVWLGPETLDSPVAFARVLFYATQAALRRCGLYELHAAAAVVPASRPEFSGSGVLVIGPSGSGKTTFAMRLAAAGWRSVADDLVLLRNDAAVEAFAYRRVFAATDTTLELYPSELIDSAVQEPNAFEPEKRRLDPGVLFPGSVAGSCTPRLLLFTVLTGDPATETGALAPSESLTRLLKMCPWAAYDRAVARPHLDALARLARQCAAYDVRAGTDLLRDPEAAPRLVSFLARGFA